MLGWWARHLAALWDRSNQDFSGKLSTWRHLSSAARCSPKLELLEIQVRAWRGTRECTGRPIPCHSCTVATDACFQALLNMQSYSDTLWGNGISEYCFVAEPVTKAPLYHPLSMLFCACSGICAPWLESVQRHKIIYYLRFWGLLHLQYSW